MHCNMDTPTYASDTPTYASDMPAFLRRRVDESRARFRARMAENSRRVMGAVRKLQHQWCETPAAREALASTPSNVTSTDEIDAAVLTCIVQIVYQLAIFELASQQPQTVVIQLQCADKAFFVRDACVFPDLDSDSDLSSKTDSDSDSDLDSGSGSDSDGEIGRAHV